MKRVNLPGPPTFSVNVTLHEAQQQARERLEQPEKVARSTVDYTVATSPNRCGVCDFADFPPGEATGVCSKITGPIQSGMVCRLFQNERAAAYDDQEVKAH